MRRNLAVLLAFGLALTSLLAAVPAGAQATVQRVAGSDRIATAVEASRAHRTTTSDALLATAASFPDALSAAALAGRLDAPLLLTHTDHVPEIVHGELQRLGVRTVWLLGGPAAVSQAVEADLLTRGYLVHRLAGDNRFATAREVALQAGPSPTAEAMVALGTHPDEERAWADAVASGALAAPPHFVPTLLTRPEALPPETEQALSELGVRHVLLLGGSSAVGGVVEQRLRELGYTVERLAGESRYHTSVAVAGKALSRTDGSVTVTFASGDGFADALSAATITSDVAGPLVLIHPDELAAVTDQFLRSQTGRWSGGVVLGGPASISDWVIQQVDAALRGEPPPQTSRTSEPDGERVVGVFEGKASWYGSTFAGRTTACGEAFDPNDLTAAHPDLPCGTRVRLTNTANGNQLIVRVNDRGPYNSDRVIDVSENAANHLGFRQEGVAWLRGEVLE